MYEFSILKPMGDNHFLRRSILFILVALSSLFAWYILSLEDRSGELTFAVLDVGQGDALFIESPLGNQMLLDGGPSRAVLEKLSYVMPFYDRTIDLVGLSHPHRDHMDGLIDVLKRYGVGAIVTSGTSNDIPEHRAFLAAASSTLVLKQGDRIDLGGGAMLDVLFPVVPSDEVSPHQGMLVMKLTYGSTSFLLTGDMEQSIEAFLSSNLGTSLRSDVLKAGHHGSDTSSSDALLGVVRPRFAVISVGAGNTYGHPKQEILDRFNENKVEVHRTDKEGTIVFKSDGVTVWVEE